MFVKELLDATNANTLVTITTCGRHGGCILMDTTSRMAKADLKDYGEGKLLNAKVSQIKVYRNTLEIVIEKEAHMEAEKKDYCLECGCEVPYYTKETEWEGNYKGAHKKARLLTAYCAKCGNRMIVKEVEYENQRRLDDELL